MKLTEQVIKNNIDFACRIENCLNVLSHEINRLSPLQALYYKIAVADLKSALSLLPQTTPQGYTPKEHLFLFDELSMLEQSFRYHTKDFLGEDEELVLIFQECHKRISDACDKVYFVYNNF